MRFKSHLRALARRSKHHRYLHAALVAQGKRILGEGVNSEGHHAEINALARAGSASKGATLYTLMLRRYSSELGNGAPCPVCMEALRLSRVRKVVVYV